MQHTFASAHVFSLQDLLQVGESYVLGVDGVLTDDELQEVLKVSGWCAHR